MLVDFRQVFVDKLKAQCNHGKHLEGVGLVQLGDQTPAAQYHKTVFIDWNDRINLASAGNGWQPQMFFAVGATATDPQSHEKADEKLQNLLVRWENDQLVGLIPALLLLNGVRGVSGRAYGVTLLPQAGRGKLTDRSPFRVGAYFVIQVYPKPLTTDDLKPL